MKAVTVTSFFHAASNTFSYVVASADNHAVIIDSALDFDPASGELSTAFADKIIQFVRINCLQLDWILETHVHADHLTAATYIKSKLGGQIALSKQLTTVRDRFAPLFDFEKGDFDPQSVDRFVTESEQLGFGEALVEIVEVPGHTPDSLAFVIHGNVFVGDTLFMPDSGTARCDFPGGSAQTLYDSIQKLYALPDDTIVWMCHDYGPGGRQVKNKTTIARCKKDNIHVKSDTSVDSFVGLREARDITLAAPKLLYPSLQANIRAGKLPVPKSEGGTPGFKIPLTYGGGLND